MGEIESRKGTDYKELKDYARKKRILLDRLNKMEAKKSDIKDIIYHKIKKDYEGQLDQLVEEFRPKLEKIVDKVNGFEEELEQIASFVEQSNDDLIELRFRHSLGEYKDDEYKTREKGLAEQLKKYNSQKEIIERVINDYKSLIGKEEFEAGYYYQKTHPSEPELEPELEPEIEPVPEPYVEEPIHLIEEEVHEEEIEEDDEDEYDDDDDYLPDELLEEELENELAEELEEEIEEEIIEEKIEYKKPSIIVKKPPQKKIPKPVKKIKPTKKKIKTKSKIKSNVKSSSIKIGGSVRDSQVTREPQVSREPQLKNKLLIKDKTSGKDLSFPLGRNEITIGRSSDNDVVLAEGKISRRHAKISLGKRGYVITDLKSANGTYVNGDKIVKQVLKENDSIQIGDSLVTFV